MSATEQEPGVQGWYGPSNSRRFHYFGSDGRSLCGFWRAIPWSAELVDIAVGPANGKCPPCKRKLAARAVSEEGYGRVSTTGQGFYCVRCKAVHAADGDCPLNGLCVRCQKRAATLHFGDALSFTHGGEKNCCALCAAEEQLAHARKMAALIPEREAEVTRLTAALSAPAVNEGRP